MFKTVKELQEFITWCKKSKIKKIKIDNIEFEVSDYGFVEDLTDDFNLNDLDKILHEEKTETKPTKPDEAKQDASNLKEISNHSQETMTDTEDVSDQEFDELLNWSSTP